MKQNSFPPGWDEERVRRVLAHHEEQTESRRQPRTKPPSRTGRLIREIAEDEKRQKAIRADGLRNAGRRA